MSLLSYTEIGIVPILVSLWLPAICIAFIGIYLTGVSIYKYRVDLLAITLSGLFTMLIFNDVALEAILGELGLIRTRVELSQLPFYELLLVALWLFVYGLPSIIAYLIHQHLKIYDAYESQGKLDELRQVRYGNDKVHIDLSPVPYAVRILLKLKRRINMMLLAHVPVSREEYELRFSMYNNVQKYDATWKSGCINFSDTKESLAKFKEQQRKDREEEIKRVGTKLFRESKTGNPVVDMIFKLAQTTLIVCPILGLQVGDYYEFGYILQVAMMLLIFEISYPIHSKLYAGLYALVDTGCIIIVAVILRVLVWTYVGVLIQL